MRGKLTAWGAKVQRSRTGAADSYTRIPESRGIAVPSITEEYKDVTSLDSPDRFREFLKGLRDAGEVSVPCWFTEAGYLEQLEDQDQLEAIFYRVEFRPLPGTTTGTAFRFTAYPSPSIDATTIEDNGIPMTIALKITGKPVVEEAA